MASITVRVDGLQELGERMRLLKSEMALKIARQATNAAAQVIKKQAKANIQSSPSIVTRSLLNSVIVKKIPNSQTNLTSEHVVTVRGRGKKVTRKGKTTTQTSAPHAHFVEFGTVNMPAEPFLRPAFDAMKERAKDALVEKIDQGLKKVGQ